MTVALLGPVEIRELAALLGIRPTKTLGQNFVHDPNSIRRIVAAARIDGERVVEIGPGLGSLTLGILEVAESVVAVEIDPVLANQLPSTLAARAPDRADRVQVVTADALGVTTLPGVPPTALVANLPYNVAVPVLLTFLERFESVQHGLVMVQSEVAQRLAAGPGGRTYGGPSAKAAWYAKVVLAGKISRNVFWPVPNVESDLVSFERRDPPTTEVSRRDVFAVIDAAFAQRRKMLRSALSGWAGSGTQAEQILQSAQIDPELRGEKLSIEDFARIAAAGSSVVHE